MLENRYNPFKPNHPVYSGVFAGRYNELKRIDSIFKQTKQSNPSNVMIVGERGIGKSSLLLYANFLAKGVLHFSNENFNFITIQVNISSDITPIEFAFKIKNAISRELGKNNKAAEIIKKTWDFLQRFEVAGVKYNKEKDERNLNVYDDLIYSIVDTIKSITSNSAISDLGLSSRKDGLLLLIDEADNAPKSLNIGAFLKNLSETLVIEDCNKLCIMMAGLPKLHDILLESHESSLRLFEEFELSALVDKDVEYIINSGLAESNNKAVGEPPITIEKNALEAIWAYSEGYPHFIQQIAFSAFKSNNDYVINDEDVIEGMFSKGGALDIIGSRYYKDLYYEKINVDSYRRILNIMAHKWNDWISKEEIKTKFSGKPSSLDNGLKALRDRNIILSKKGSPGFYRLQWRSFAFWIKTYTENEHK